MLLVGDFSIILQKCNFEPMLVAELSRSVNPSNKSSKSNKKRKMNKMKSIKMLEPLPARGLRSMNDGSEMTLSIGSGISGLGMLPDLSKRSNFVAFPVERRMFKK